MIKNIKETGMVILKWLLLTLFKLIWAIPTAYMVAWSCDTLFDTMLMENIKVLYLTLILTIPMVIVQFTSYKKESK